MNEILAALKKAFIAERDFQANQSGDAADRLYYSASQGAAACDAADAFLAASPATAEGAEQGAGWLTTSHGDRTRFTDKPDGFDCPTCREGQRAVVYAAAPRFAETSRDCVRRSGDAMSSGRSVEHDLPVGGPLPNEKVGAPVAWRYRVRRDHPWTYYTDDSGEGCSWPDADPLYAAPTASREADATWTVERDDGEKDNDPGIFVRDQNGYVIAHFFDIDPSREGVAALLGSAQSVTLDVFKRGGKAS